MRGFYVNKALFTGFLLGLSITCPSKLFAKKITVMSYNVENLFDTFHDEGKQDFTYLPKWVKQQNPDVYKYCKSQTVYKFREECFKIDWTIPKLNKKFQSLTKVISVVNKGKGPDIIALQEVENINVLNLWMEHSLSELGYKEVVLIEGPDNRGIDGAIVSKFPLASEPVYHEFFIESDPESVFGLASVFEATLRNTFISSPLEKNKTPRRGIIEATFAVGGGKELTVMSNHWPSQSNPASDRYQIAKVLHKAATEIAESGRALVSMGDYNTTDADKPNGLEEWLLNKNRKIHFYDARAEHLIEVGPNSKNLPGSHWYRGHYTALDKILVLESTASQIEPDWLSFKVIAEDFMMIEADRGPYKYKPYRFDFETAEGFTDHLPITLDLKI